MVLFPCLHKGNRTRTAGQVAGGSKYKPPRHDINAPDLHLPLMAFATYIMLCGFTQRQARKIKPAGISGLVTKATNNWMGNGNGDTGGITTPSGEQRCSDIDVVAYGGKGFQWM